MRERLRTPAGHFEARDKRAFILLGAALLTFAAALYDASVHIGNVAVPRLRELARLIPVTGRVDRITEKQYPRTLARRSEISTNSAIFKPQLGPYHYSLGSIPVA